MKTWQRQTPRPRRPFAASAGSVLVALLVCIGGLGCPATDGESRPALSTLEARFSYGVGVRLGRDLRASDHPIDAALVLRGLRDALAGRAAFDKAQVEAALAAYGDRVRERQAQQQAELHAKMRVDSKAFLDAQRRRKGVQQLASGVLYEVLRRGHGEPPSIDDDVTCHFRGQLPDGSVFQDTRVRENAPTFVVSSVVDGLEEALQRMRPGAHWRIYVPPALAYGASGFGAQIPPNAALMFDVELLAVIK